MSEAYVSVVIPLYEEKAVIPRLLEALDKLVTVMEDEGRPTEVIIVDDGSRDGSWEVLSEAPEDRPWLHLVRLRRNFGQTAAISAGFDRAKGELIVPMDADMQNDPADVPSLVKKLEEGYDVVSGWRKNRKDGLFTRRIPSWAANHLTAWLSGLPLHDFGCTLKAYRREFLEPHRLYGEMHRFIPVYALWSGARVTEQIVQHHARVEGTSKYGLERTLKVALDLLTLKLLGDYSTKPLYLFGRWGLLSCFVGIVCGGITLFQKFAYGVWVHKNPLLLLAVMLFLMGIQLLGMGLLAELQVRTYHESQRKKTYLVGEEKNTSCAESLASSRPAEGLLEETSSPP